jgi:hypothetical protein
MSAKPASISPAAIRFCHTLPIRSICDRVMKTFWAHSDRFGLAEDDPNAHWQPLAERLVHVGSLARQLASLAAPKNTNFQLLAEWDWSPT